jgi:hypothetical protein
MRPVIYRKMHGTEGPHARYTKPDTESCTCSFLYEKSKKIHQK